MYKKKGVIMSPDTEIDVENSEDTLHSATINADDVVVTGDRPSGALHLGHYVGSLKQRIQCESLCSMQYIIVADLQALTDNYKNPEIVHKNVLEVVKDYLAVGLNPEKSVFFLQSLIPELAELTVHFMNLVTLSRLRRNPTVKAEALQKGYGENIKIGFLTYPISQAADILGFQATLVPVGKDQAPMIEQTNEIATSFNLCFESATTLFKPCRALYGDVSRLIGTDGKAKASKSLGNAIYLHESDKSLREKIRSMPTDPGHIRLEDPGCVEGNVVFSYLDAFYEDKVHLENLKDYYRRGGLGDVVLKNLLYDVLEAFIKPIREKRAQISDADAWSYLEKGTQIARKKVYETLMQARKNMGLRSY